MSQQLEPQWQPRLSRHMGDDQDRQYAEQLTLADTLERLKELLTNYRPLAEDAFQVVETMTEDDFQEFRKGLKKERKGRFAGEAWAEKYAAIVMPLPMMRVTEVAAQFKAPFGVTWQRCKDLRPDLLAVPETKP